MSGWIKLHREIFDSDIWHDVTTFRLFVYLIGKASHQDGINHKGLVLNKGQFVRSYRKLADDLTFKEGRGYKKYSLSTIKNSIKKLVDDERIAVDETKLGTLFTIINYEKYQETSQKVHSTPNTYNEKRDVSPNVNRTVHRTPNDERNTYNGNGCSDVENVSPNALKSFNRTPNDEKEPVRRTISRINTITTTTKENNAHAREKDPVDEIANKFVDLRTMQEGRVVYPNPKDYESITRVVARGMPLPQTIQLLEQCFAEYNKRDPHGRITSFRYCEKYIVDRFEEMKAREIARQAAKRSVKNHVKHDNRSFGQTTKQNDSITGGQVGRIRRKTI